MSTIPQNDKHVLAETFRLSTISVAEEFVGGHVTSGMPSACAWIEMARLTGDSIAKGLQGQEIAQMARETLAANPDIKRGSRLGLYGTNTGVSAIVVAADVFALSGRDVPLADIRLADGRRPEDIHQAISFLGKAKSLAIIAEYPTDIYDRFEAIMARAAAVRKASTAREAASLSVTDALRLALDYIRYSTDSRQLGDSDRALMAEIAALVHETYLPTSLPG